jgi:hypothetical protein
MDRDHEDRADRVDRVDRAVVHAALDAVLDAARGSGQEPWAEALRAAATVRAVIDGAMVPVVAGFEASMMWAGDGHRSPVSWMVAHLGAARAAAAGERRVALAADRMPHVAAAAQAGALCAAKLRLVVDARRAPVEAAFDRDEQALVAHARELGVDALRVRLDRWYYDALAELGANKPDRDPGGSDRNVVRLRPGFSGRGLLEGDLSPEARGTLEAAVSAEIDRWRREGSLEAGPAAGTSSKATHSWRWWPVAPPGPTAKELDRWSSPWPTSTPSCGDRTSAQPNAPLDGPRSWAWDRCRTPWCGSWPAEPGWPSS